MDPEAKTRPAKVFKIPFGEVRCGERFKSSFGGGSVYVKLKNKDVQGRRITIAAIPWGDDAKIFDINAVSNFGDLCRFDNSDIVVVRRSAEDYFLLTPKVKFHNRKPRKKP